MDASTLEFLFEPVVLFWLLFQPVNDVFYTLLNHGME